MEEWYDYIPLDTIIHRINTCLVKPPPPPPPPPPKKKKMAETTTKYDIRKSTLLPQNRFTFFDLMMKLFKMEPVSEFQSLVVYVAIRMYSVTSYSISTNPGYIGLCTHTQTEKETCRQTGQLTSRNNIVTSYIVISVSVVSHEMMGFPHIRTLYCVYGYPIFEWIVMI